MPPVVIVVAGAAAAAATGFVVYKYVWEPFVSPRMEAWRTTAFYTSQRHFRHRSRGEPIIIPTSGSSSALGYGFGDHNLRNRYDYSNPAGIELMDMDAETPTAASMAERGSMFPYTIPAYHHLSTSATPSGTVTPTTRIPSPDVTASRIQQEPVSIQSPRSPASIASLSDFSHVDPSQAFSPFSQPSVLSDNGLSNSFASLTPDSVDTSDPFANPIGSSSSSGSQNFSPSSQNLSIEELNSDSEDMTGSWLSVNSSDAASHH